MDSGQFETPDDSPELEGLETGVEFILREARREDAGTNAAVAESPSGHTVVILDASVENVPEALRRLASVLQKQGETTH